VRSWWPSLVSYFPTPQLAMGAGLSLLAKEAAACGQPTENDTPERGADIGGSHGRNADPNRWFLCRLSDTIRTKKPPSGGSRRDALDQQLRRRNISPAYLQSQALRRRPRPAEHTTDAGDFP
jgi:hypothetical protein